MIDNVYIIPIDRYSYHCLLHLNVYCIPFIVYHTSIWGLSLSIASQCLMLCLSLSITPLPYDMSCRYTCRGVIANDTQSLYYTYHCLLHLYHMICHVDIHVSIPPFVYHTSGTTNVSKVKRDLYMWTEFREKTRLCHKRIVDDVY